MKRELFFENNVVVVERIVRNQSERILKFGPITAREISPKPKRSWNRFEYACWPSVHDVERRIKKVVTSAHEIFVIPCSLLDIYGAVRSVYLLCAAEKDATVAYLVFVYKNLEQHVRFKFR